VPAGDHHGAVEIFRQRLAAARRLRGLNQAELAFELRKRGLSISPGDVSRWETGATKNPGLEKVAEIARVLKVSTDYLLGVREDPTPGGPLDGMAAHLLAGVATGPSAPAGSERSETVADRRGTSPEPT
jgi:transcriptional regulator with XRE-family HTH domain